MANESYTMSVNNTMPNESVVLGNSSDILPNGTFYDPHYSYDDYDMSMIDFPPSLFKVVPLWEAVVKVVVYVIIIVSSLVGNTLIILVVMWNKRLRTTTNFYIVNLAVSDLLVTVSCSWVHVVDDLTTGWILGEFFCKFNSFAQVTSLVSSIMSLTLIACDRFFGIVFAMKAHIIERRACHSIVCIWVCSIAVGVPLLFVRRVYRRHWKDFTEQWCSDDWPSEEPGTDEFGNTIYHHTSRKAYWTVVCVALFLIPIVVMCVAYCGIIKTLWESKVPGERISNDETVQTKVKRKVVIMLILIMVVFCVCWIPVQCSVLYTEYRPTNRIEDWYEHFDYFVKLLAFSNSAMNPIIYAGFNDNFRKGFKLMFECYRKKRYSTLSKMEDSCHSTTTMTTSMSATTHITRM